MSSPNASDIETLTQQGLKDEAITLREIISETLGERHPEYATMLNSLGDLYELTGRYALAEPLFTQALEVLKKTLGEQHVRYATGLNSSPTWTSR